MSNLYEKQALDNYLNDGITHGKKISYGSLGRSIHVNSERQHIIMNSKLNSKLNSIILPQPVNPDTVNPDTVNPEMQSIIMINTKNEDNSSTNDTELSRKTKNIILKQKHALFQKLSKEEQICEHILNYWPKPEFDV